MTDPEIPSNETPFSRRVLHYGLLAAGIGIGTYVIYKVCSRK
jgi:hypothetical protein